MKRTFLTPLVMLLCLFVSCTGSKSWENIDYQLADGYFVRNDAPSEIPAYIDSEDTFESYFGMAPVMGEDGMPTKIDFSKQSVIPIVLQPTDYSTNIIIDNVGQKGDSIVANCTIVKEGKPQTYIIQPCALVVIARPEKTPKVSISYRDK